MKKTQFLELFCNIKATLVSFLSIVMFVALGIGLYSGLCWTGQSLENQLDNTFKKGNLHAFEMTFPYGFTDDDIEAIKDVEGVSAVEGGYLSGQTLYWNNDSFSTNVRCITPSIDTLTVDEGTLPSNPDEIALNSLFAKKNNLAVGDVITFAHDDTANTSSSGMKYLNADSYTVTALVTSPAYIATNSATYGVSASGSGAVDALAYVTEQAFNASAFNNAYVSLLVECNELNDLNVFSDEYQKKLQEIEGRIASTGESRAQAQYQNVIAQANAKIADGEAKLQNAQAQIENGQQQLKNAQNTINSSTRKLEDAQLELDVTSKMLSSQKAITEETLNQASSVLNKYQTLYDKSRSEFEQKVAEIDTLKSQISKVSEALSHTDEAFSSLENQKKELDQQLQAGEISQAEYDSKLETICELYNTSLSIAESTIKANAPKVYESYKASFDDFFTNATIHPATFDSDLIKARIKFDSVKSSLSAANTALASNAKEAEKMKAELDKLQASLTNLQTQYNQKKAEYEGKIQSAESQITAGQATVSSGKARIASAQSTLDGKKTELESAQEQYNQGVQQLEDAKKQVSETVQMNWITTSNHYNGTIQAANEIVGMLYRLRFSMASLFVIVGLLVCYSAVSRIIHEQVSQLGTKKAIGFKNSEVTLSYLAYSALAVAIGAILGIGIAMLIVEPILLPSVNQYVLPTPGPSFGLGDFVLITLIELVLILLSTWIACRSILKRNAIDLLQGEKPPSNKQRFYEKWNIWNRLGLFTQTVINNCVNDKRRVIGTLIGVAGCTALIVAAITLDDNVNSGFSKQTNEVNIFNTFVQCTPGTAASSNSKSDSNANNSDECTVGAYLDNNNLAHATVQRKTFIIDRPDNEQSVISVYTPENPDEFGSLFHLNALSSSGGTGVLDGAWVCSAYANQYHANVGDVITIENAAGQKFEIPIAGFFEYYSTVNCMVLSESAYERIIGTQVSYDSYIVNANSVSELQTQLAEQTSNFVSCNDENARMESLSKTFNNLSRTMVAIYIALSALMAVIVLLNLNVMFIEEKKRELIVLMINGYSTKDAKRYVYRDTIVMAIVGIILGCLLGIAMGYLSVSSLENASFSILKVPSLKACAIGAVLSAIFTAIMTKIALRKIPKFNLTDINKF